MKEVTYVDKMMRLEKKLQKKKVFESRVMLGGLADISDVSEFLIPVKQLAHNQFKLLYGLIQYDKLNAWSSVERPMVANAILKLCESIYKMVPDDVAPANISSLEELALAFEEAVDSDDSEKLLQIAKATCCQAWRTIGDLPLGEMNEAGKELYFELLEKLGDARKSKSQGVKKEYLDFFSRKVTPKLWSDIPYFQAISFFVSYLHIDFECRIPFTPHTFMFIPVLHRPVLEKTKYLELVEILMQTGGPGAGIKIRLWRGVDEKGNPTNLYCFDCVGTNSESPDRDAVMKELGISTGVLADIDRNGIADRAFKDLIEQIDNLFKGLPKDAIFIDLGHSLAATIAFRLFCRQRDLGYENVYMLGFNGGAFNNEVDANTIEAAQTKVGLFLNKGDVVPYGGSHLPPGETRTYDPKIGGTIAVSQHNPFFGKSRDIINHGVPGEVASYLCGVPAWYSVSLAQNLQKGLMRMVDGMLNSWCPWLREKIITTALKPDKSEWDKTEVSFIKKEFVSKK